MRHDPRPMHLAALAGRIDALAAQGRQMSLMRLSEEVDGIRHSAGVLRLPALEALAGSLETILALHGLGGVAMSYLDRMRDAVTADAPCPVPSVTPAYALRA